MKAELMLQRVRHCDGGRACTNDDSVHISLVASREISMDKNQSDSDNQ